MPDARAIIWAVVVSHRDGSEVAVSGLPPPRRTPFVGRAHELTTLRACLEAATQGAGGVALVAGEPGIGKSRLLA